MDGVTVLTVALLQAIVLTVVMGGAGAVVAQSSHRLKLLWLAFIIVAIWAMRP